MFDTVLKEITGHLDKRFLTGVFFPSLAFCGLGLGLVVVNRGVGGMVATWEAQPAEIRAFLIILFLAAVAFLAYLLDSHLSALTRLYEGYWTPLPGSGWIARKRRKYYRDKLSLLNAKLEALGKRKAELDQCLASPSAAIDEALVRAELQSIEAERREVYAEMHLRFPPVTRPDAVLCTRLGNILKSAELHPLLRYNVDAVLIWPRLHPLLPEPFAARLADAKGAMDLMLVVSFLSACFAALGGSYLLLVRADWALFLAAFWGALLVSWLGYRGALEAAVGYGQLIEAAFDLHRGAVIRALGLKMPTSLSDERELWNNIDKYLYRGILEQPDAYQYAVPEAPKEATQ